MAGLSTPKFLRICLLLFSFCFLSNCGPSQETDLEPVRIPLNHIANSKAKVIYTHQKSKNGKSRKEKITAALEIKSKSGEGFIGSWTIKSVHVDGVLIDESSEQAATLFPEVSLPRDLPIGFTLNFVTASNGKPVKLLNNKEDLFTELTTSNAYNSETVERVINFYKSGTEQEIVDVFLKIPAFMSVCQDTNFKVGETYNFPTEQPSPFGEGIIVGNESYELTSLDTKNDIANIEFRTKFDLESAKQTIIESLKKLAPDIPAPPRSFIDELIVDRKDSADCKVDMSTGWATKIKYSFMVSVSGQTQEEIYDISINWIQ